MTELLTAAQMRAIEQAAIASGEVTGLELMERAGRGVVEAIFEEWPELKAGSFRAVVLCGPGNNGGDGFVVARLLKEWGWEVEVFLYGTPERMPPDARVNYERWRGLGEVAVLDAYNFVQAVFSRATQETNFAAGAPVLIDAIFGTGLTRPTTGDLAKIVGFLSDMTEFGRGAVVAVDIASGLCADSGRVLGKAAAASLVVTFHRAKRGHYLQDGPDKCGKLTLCDISLKSGAEGIGLAEPRQDVAFKSSRHHKFSHGHALILSGPPGYSGAARLAARGALRIGAGLVTVGSPADAIPEHAARLDAVMLRAVADGDGLADMLGDARINAVCVGPGLGLDARAAGLVAAALGVATDAPPPPAPPHEGEGSRLGRSAAPDEQALPLPLVGSGEGRGARKTVLDADALTLLSRDATLFAALHDECVLTPHAGEFARLFPDIAEKLDAPATTGPAYSKVDATREAAKRAGCAVLYKGPDTVIADPSGRCAINSAHYDRAAPWLATAGSGDVLSGFITGLLARAFSPFDAACTGAWLHVECARKFGPGLIAEDLPEQLPAVFRDLGL
ncbi:MAG: NAD(P)H-hydrate epimerase [Paracoccaceae bacterium]